MSAMVDGLPKLTLESARRGSSPFRLSAVYRDVAMSLRQLRWLAMGAPALLVVVLEVTRYAVLGGFSWRQRLLLDAVAALTLVALYSGMFRLIGRMQARLRRQNEELLSLHSAGLDIASELSLDALLKKVVERARSLLDARYGALSIVDAATARIETFITSGISDEERAMIGPPPVGHGVLGIVLKEGETLRLADVSKHPRSHGFPPNHPMMRTLLAVPVQCKSPFVGNLYVAEKTGGHQFSEDDEETLDRFAVQVARAIDNAYLHQQVRDLAIAEERIRIAHEMHDGVAQVLGYVNTKAQAASEYLRQAKTDAAETQLREMTAAAREAYVDVRESIVALRSLPDPSRPLEQVITEYVDQWQRQTGIQTHTRIEGDIRIAPSAELQVLRIIQESLTNVRKHARAKSVRVELRRSASGLHVVIADDGTGFDPETRTRKDFPRFGLTTMRERAESISATLRIESAPGRGTTVEMHLPG